MSRNIKKAFALSALFLIPFLVAAGSVYIIYNEVNADTLRMGHTGQETLSYVVGGVEKKTLTEDDIRTLYNDMYYTDYDDIVFHTFPASTLFDQPRTYYLPVHVDMKATVAGSMQMTFNVPPDMTVQVGHTIVQSGDTVHTFTTPATEQIDIFFYFEGETVEFRDGEFTIDFAMKLIE